jgi:hypothetical protein
VSSDYFRTLDVPTFGGRDFNESDLLNAPPVAIVNQVFAKNYFGETDPVGKVFGVRQDGGKPDKIYRIVGLVGNTKYGNLREDDGPIVYLPQSQDPAPDPDTTLLIQSDEESISLISSLKNIAARINPGMVLNFTELRTAIRQGLGRERLMASLSGFYGVLAAILSVIGLYGIMSYSVAQRTSEIGIRMALGATRGKILMMIASESLSLLGVGLAVGIVLVIAAGRSVQALLFGLRPTDPLTLCLAMAGMTVVALFASLLPALRAAAVQPIQTLREQ